MAGDKENDPLGGEREVNATTAATRGEPTSALAALAANDAWGAVYEVLKGPCVARAAELQKSSATGKKGRDGAISSDLAECLDNMARCTEVRTTWTGNGGQRWRPLIDLWSAQSR